MNENASETSFENLIKPQMKNRETLHKKLIYNDSLPSMPSNTQNIINRSGNSNNVIDGGIKVSHLVSNETLKDFSNTQLMFNNSNMKLNSNMKISSIQLASKTQNLSTSNNISSADFIGDKRDKSLNTPLNEWMKHNIKDEEQKKTMMKIKKKLDPHQKKELGIFNKEIESLINELIKQGLNPISFFNFDGKVFMKFNDQEERRKAFGVISAIPKERLGRKGMTLRCYSGKFKIKEY